jgi:hypothetical protein
MLRHVLWQVIIKVLEQCTAFIFGVEDPEPEDTTLLWNVGDDLTDFTVSRVREH